MLQFKEEGYSWLGAMVEGAGISCALCMRDFSMVEVAILIISIMHGYKDNFI